MSNKKFCFHLNKGEPDKKRIKVDSVFDCNDDEEDVSTKIKYESDKVHKIEEEDNDLYDYDAAYDQIQAEKLKKIMKKIEDDNDKKPKYVEKIMEAQKKRELDRFLAEERKIQKEREEEKGKYYDKEIFISSSYRKKLEEIAELRKAEEEKEKEDELVNEKILKRGILRTGLHRDFLLNLDNSEPSNSKNEVAFRNIKNKKDKKDNVEPEKSIYDEEEEDEMRPVIKPSYSTKGDKKIKGGLEIRKKQVDITKKEKIDDVTIDTEITNEKLDNNIEEKPLQEDVKPKINDVRVLPKELRLQKICEIMKQRNTEPDIKAYQKRYMLRKLRGEIVPSM
uniref:DUF2040 domain-containing protein n=1 Tax=Strongyloides venezuelensis TaxID=75913 RepID=A0A0K0F7N1_STRVS